MSEVSMRNTMREKFMDVFHKHHPHWVRIEDTVGIGVPDINWCVAGCEGWIEAKQLDKDDLPKRAATPVRIGLRQEQVMWLTMRAESEGNVCVIAKIDREWFVFTEHFQRLKDGVAMQELRSLAFAIMSKFDPHVLIRANKHLPFGVL